MLRSFDRSFDSFRARLSALGIVSRIKRLDGKCALDDDIRRIMPRMFHAVSMSLDDLARSAEHYAEAVARAREEYESHYRDNQKRVVAYAWELSYMVNPDDNRVAYEYASACLKANRAKTARMVLESIAAQDDKASKYIAAAKRKLARLAWKQGDVETAVRTLRSVRGRSAKSQFRAWLGELTVRNGLLLAESGDGDSARDIVQGGLLGCGMSKPLAEGVTAVYLAAACQMPVNAGSTAPPRVSPASPTDRRRTPVILSGFGWSGSGAVADFLKGHPKVADVFGGREIGLWTGRYGLDRLYTHFETKGFNRRLLLEFLTRHCFGHSFLADSRGTKSLGGIWAWLDDPQRWMLLEALNDWLRALREWQTDHSFPLLKFFQILSSRLLDLLTPADADCILLSNCVPSDAILGVRMFEAPAVIVSWRDPTDAYASKIAAFPDNSLTFNKWQAQLMSRVNNYLAGKRQVAHHAKLWIDLSFEEFVHSNTIRETLMSDLRLEGQPTNSTFDPSVSARNIGIFRPLNRKNRSVWETLATEVRLAKTEAEGIPIRSRSRPQLN